MTVIGGSVDIQAKATAERNKQSGTLMCLKPAKICVILCKYFQGNNSRLISDSSLFPWLTLLLVLQALMRLKQEIQFKCEHLTQSSSSPPLQRTEQVSKYIPNGSLITAVTIWGCILTSKHYLIA